MDSLCQEMYNHRKFSTKIFLTLSIRTLSPLLFNFALEYVISTVQVNQDGFKLNGTHQLLVYADNNKLGESVHTIKKTQKL